MPLIRILGDHFGFIVKEDGDHFGLEAFWGRVEVDLGDYLGSWIISGRVQFSSSQLRYFFLLPQKPKISKF